MAKRFTKLHDKHCKPSDPLFPCRCVMALPVSRYEAMLKALEAADKAIGAVEASGCRGHKAVYAEPFEKYHKAMAELEGKR